MRAHRSHWIGVLLLAAAFAGCGDSTDPQSESGSPKVVVIGWDAASWSVIEPLLQRGELPQLAALIERGGRGVLQADPPLFSPVVWTTLATGFPPAEHGITDFEMPDPTGEGRVLASSFHRRRAAIWQMLATQGRSSGFVGWWATWPAEPVLGYQVSDHLAYNRWDDWAVRGNKSQGGRFQLTWPEELASELRPFAVRPEELPVEELTRLVPFNESEQREMMEARAPVKFHAPSVMRFGYTTDASNQAFARHLLETREQPDLFAVVYVLSDIAGHVLWHHYQPELYPDAPADAGRLREAIPNVYRLLDRFTGEILERVDPQSVVLVISDHGMGAKRILPRPGINPAGDHTREGIFVAAGGAVPAGANLGVLRQIDLVPTLLALLDLPIADDMPGRVAGTVAGENAEGLARIPSYGRGDVADLPEALSPAEQEYEERLRSLGYIR